MKGFSCLEWMATLVIYIPDRGGKTVRCLSYYSNDTRGRLKKEGDEPQFYIIENGCHGELNRSWARLIQKIHEVNPLICPKLRGETWSNCLKCRLFRGDQKIRGKRIPLSPY